MPSNKIRQDFLDHFAARGHHIVDSAPLPMPADATTMFVVAGMVPFMDVFLGTGTRPWKRVADTQKVLRVSGKHNDLDEVGRDGTHHTFFEMLGNWSFGDYFQAEAIQWHWELFTGTWGLPKDRLHATVFGGDERHGIPRDDDAARLWTEMTDIDPSHIHYFPGVENDNFWASGETGACGPCSEIHIDLTPDGSGAQDVNGDNPLVTELGNLVFIQYNRTPSGELVGLPAKHVDTGSGFERLVRVLNGVDSSYDTDLFQPILEAISGATGTRPYAGKWHDETDDAYRIVADHVRALTFTIADGVLPSNEGAGYVMRRILRRAARHARQSLHGSRPFIHELVPVVATIMGKAFPDLASKAAHVEAVIEDEERSFARTLDRGIALFDIAASRGRIAAEDAFRLYDTYGFPVDLTEQMAVERGLEVDLPGYERLMDEQRERARGAAGTGPDPRAALLPLAQQAGFAATEFLTSLEETVSGPILLCRLTSDTYEIAARATPGDRVAVATERTPFYGEAGGQVGDTGVISTSDWEIAVTDTIRAGNVWFHLGDVLHGVVNTGTQDVTMAVDAERRELILGNHTGTHMMNLALRHVLGDHVDQKGSLVDDAKLRFDLSHPSPVAVDELARIEEHVMRDIGAALPVYAAELPQADALKIRNIRAVFGEKYPPVVRVVSVGMPVEALAADPSNPNWDEYSIELCGGTHLGTSDQAQAFTIVSEEAVAKGVRRLVAFTGAHAVDARRRGGEALSSDDLATLQAAASDHTLPAVVRAKVREKAQELQAARRAAAASEEAALAGSLVTEILALEAGQNAIVGRVSDADGGALRAAVEQARGRVSKPILVAAVSGEAASLVAAVPKDMTGTLKAGDWIRHAAEAAGGRGGGKPDIAQAGVRDLGRLDDALAAARAYAG